LRPKCQQCEQEAGFESRRLLIEPTIARLLPHFSHNSLVEPPASGPRLGGPGRRTHSTPELVLVAQLRARYPVQRVPAVHAATNWLL